MVTVTLSDTGIDTESGTMTGSVIIMDKIDWFSLGTLKWFNMGTHKVSSKGTPT